MRGKDKKSFSFFSSSSTSLSWNHHHHGIIIIMESSSSWNHHHHGIIIIMESSSSWNHHHHGIIVLIVNQPFCSFFQGRPIQFPRMRAASVILLLLFDICNTIDTLGFRNDESSGHISVSNPIIATSRILWYLPPPPPPPFFFRSFIHSFKRSTAA
jgi:hypothetical protein